MVAPNDPEIIHQQYDTDENLRVRQYIHSTYTVPKMDFAESVIDSMRWRRAAM